MEFIKRARATLHIAGLLTWRLLLGFSALYLGTLTFTLFDAYGFEKNNVTEVSFYLSQAFWSLFLFPFQLIDSRWGILLVALQFLMFFFLLQKNSKQLNWLMGLALFPICLGFGLTLWTDGAALIDFLCSFLVIGGLYSIAKRIARRRHNQSPPHPIASTGTHTIEAVILMVFLCSGLVYLYLEFYFPNRQLNDPKAMANPAKARIIAQKVISHRLGNDHDAFLYLASVGTEESVPYLINALQWQEYTPPGKEGMICTKAHCLGALRSLTNQNPGVNYADWAPWWKSNRTKTRRQWVLDGFIQKGLPVSDPPNEAFIAALVSDVSPRGSINANAVWLLEQVPPDRSRAAIERALHSNTIPQRKAALAYIISLHWPDAVDKITPLLKDPDVDIRKSAEHALKRIEDEKKQKQPSP